MSEETKCLWCNTDATKAAAQHVSPHATWCVHFRRDQSSEPTFKQMMLGEWPVSYEWPRLLRLNGSRQPGKTQDQARWSALQQLMADARKQFWDARRTSSVVAKAIRVGLDEGLEEVEALLLAVTGLLEQNSELAEEVQRLTEVVNATQDNNKR